MTTRRPPIAATILTMLLGACGGGESATPPPDAEMSPPDARPIPVFRNPRPDLTDEALAAQALQLLGASDPGDDDNCDVCHALTRPKLEAWLALSDAALSTCLANLDLASMTSEEAAEVVQCLRSDPELETSRFHADRLGIYATAASLPWFDYLFWLSADDGSRDAFASGAAMPRGAHPPFTQDEFDVIAEWFARDLPHLELVPLPPVTVCTPEISPDMEAHIDTMATEGWRAVNAAGGMDMLGCASAATPPRECLAAYTNVDDTTYGQDWNDHLPGSQLRVLRVNDYASMGSTRTSPDGRFVAHGEDSQIGPDRGVVIDLQRDELVLFPDVLFHPAFFPDGQGFLFQRIQKEFATVLCAQDVLTAVPPPAVVLSDDPQCRIWYGNTLQQHLARELESGDYWSVYGTLGGELSGGSADPSTNFAEDAVAHLVPVVFDGTHFVPQAATDLGVPFEGDAVPSPSARLLVTRVAGDNQQEGYRIHALETVDAPAIAEYCVNGGKPSLSFDERFMTYSHAPTHLDAAEFGYGPTDPAFLDGYVNKLTNVYVVDLLTGERTRVTDMPAGSDALYPQFRSDGWIYFLARRGSTEYVVASDAALLIAGE